MINYRARIESYLNSPSVHGTVGALIILNLFNLGLSTSPEIVASYGFLLNSINFAILLLFVIEVVARIYAERSSFFKSGWNIFDFIVVSLAVISFGGMVQLFRILRIVWLLRLITIFPQFKTLISSIIKAVPNLLAVIFLITLLIYVFAVIGTLEFSSSHPQVFGNLKTSMNTLIRAMLMEGNWGELLKSLEEMYPHAWIYVIPLMVLINYLLLHLVIGVILSALTHQLTEEKEENTKQILKPGGEKHHHLLSTEIQLVLYKLNVIEKRIEKEIRELHS